jgi:hypothetical protein
MQDYVQGSDAHRPDASSAATQQQSLLSYVRLPEPLTRYDASTGKLWVGEYGPMSTGDEVVLVGSEGWQQEWHTTDFEYTWSKPLGPVTPVCSADVSFWAASMSPAGTDLAEVPSTAELPGLGLFPWDPEQLEPQPGPEVGRIIIEPPCVYYIRETLDPTNWEATRIEPATFFMHLKRPLVRFDAESGTLWYGEGQSFTTGERVLAVAWQRPATEQAADILADILDAGCSAEGTNGMRHSFVTFLAPCDDPPADLRCK